MTFNTIEVYTFLKGVHIKFVEPTISCILISVISVYFATIHLRWNKISVNYVEKINSMF